MVSQRIFGNAGEIFDCPSWGIFLAISGLRLGCCWAPYNAGHPPRTECGMTAGVSGGQAEKPRAPCSLIDSFKKELAFSLLLFIPGDAYATEMSVAPWKIRSVFTTFPRWVSECKILSEYFVIVGISYFHIFPLEIGAGITNQGYIIRCHRTLLGAFRSRASFL